MGGNENARVYQALQQHDDNTRLLEHIERGQRRTLRWLQVGIVLLAIILALQIWRYLN